jgi:hypothetical protein
LLLALIVGYGTGSDKRIYKCVNFDSYFDILQWLAELLVIMTQVQFLILTRITNNKILRFLACTYNKYLTCRYLLLAGALVVKGGVGIGGDLIVGGTITASKLVIEYTTITTGYFAYNRRCNNY